ncbi:MAG: glycoside hydrolase family 3 N-terminal domain-containing protein [Alphaproteobacteria bacterium]|nr:glycoside hydrolase family 3 N-terminal domain-containing protein [Alphaproteobacteria bacterium]
MACLKPVILGCSGLVLTPEERQFFAEIRPFGFILFKRNCSSVAQLKALVDSLRDSVEDATVPVFIDQEGGRVARLNAPVWDGGKAFRVLGEAYEQDPEAGSRQIIAQTEKMAAQLLEVGINGNCAPVLDLMIEGASEAIGDRTVSADPEVVAACGRLVVQTYLDSGIFPIIKHMPGHGRVQVDPHIDLPFVDAPLSELEADFKPFIALREAPLAMNCHVLFRAIDNDFPVSLSKKAHAEIIRGRIGYAGLILSDDVSMGSLKMPLAERGLAVLEAGADIALFGTGNLEDSQAVCSTLPVMKDESLLRWQKAQESCRKQATLAV